MNVTFSATGPLKRRISGGGIVLDLPPRANVRDALQAASEQLGGDTATILLDESGQVQSGIVVFVNDEMVRNAAEKQFADGDELTILMPVAGGG